LAALILAVALPAVAGVSGPDTAAAPEPVADLCLNPPEPVAVGTAQWNGWGRDLDNSRYQPEPAIRAADVRKLALKWSFGLRRGALYGQPAVVDGRLFATSSTGRVYALDSRTGCTYWAYDATAGSRTGVVVGELAQAKRSPWPKKSKSKLAHIDVRKTPSAAIFGDDSGTVYALDAQKGTLLWRTQVDTHPLARIAGTPTLYHDRVYVAVASDEAGKAASPNYSCCTFRGSVVALDIATGQVLWKTYMIPEDPQPYRKNSAGLQEFGPAGAAISSSPTVDVKRGALYVSTGSSYTDAPASTADAIVALDLTDGKMRWAKQLAVQDSVGAGAFDGSPILRTLVSGKQILMAGQQSGVVYGLDPDGLGEVLWQTKAADAAAPGGVGVGPAADHRSLFVSITGALARPENSFGSLTALDMKTGARRWYTPSPSPACTWTDRACSHAQAQAITVMPGIAFAGSMDGHLRAYSTIDGNIVWDFDTAKDFDTVNHVSARGGSLRGGGAAIVNGIVYVNSGYDRSDDQPGSVLLAFSVDGK
jgi:polyvinyl alcohol dehydrogenase (cytochrome)